MSDQEIFDAYVMGTHLEVRAGDGWVNCVIQDMVTGMTEGIREARLMILDPQGYPTDIPAQVLSKHNFGRLRKKAPPSDASPTQKNVTQCS
jgi:hypothetical protein